MNKKLLAVAVAGALAAPVAALAQSSVTISGKVIATFGNYKIANFNPSIAVVALRGANPGNSSETIVKDESSRVIFEMREDLGGGLAAIGKLDFRPSLSDSGAAGVTGESFVGLTSKNWGTLTMGKHDLHYGGSASFTGVHLGLQTNPTAIMDRAAAGTVAIANQTRTQNVVRYGSPKFGNMFEVVVAYSANATPSGNLTAGNTVANEGDVGSIARKGSAWNIAPKIWGANWEAGYSYWVAKPDAATAALAVDKQRGDNLYGWYKWGGLRVGLAWNKSKVDARTAAAPAGTVIQVSNRTAWGIPIGYNWGSHNVYFDWYKARADKATALSGLDTKANFLGLAYAYDLSKRTSAGVSYTRINNGSAAVYNMFSSQQAILFGEDPRFIGVTLQHRY
jgi:predicted porin